MISTAGFILELIFVCIFFVGCISIGYLAFGKLLDKVSRRSEHVLLGGQEIDGKDLSSYIDHSIERIPAPNLQILESLMLTMDTVNMCMDDFADSTAICAADMHKKTTLKVSQEKEVKKENAGTTL